MTKSISTTLKSNDFVQDEILYTGISSKKFTEQEEIQESEKSKLLQSFLMFNGKFQVFCADSTD